MYNLQNAVDSDTLFTFATNLRNVTLLPLQFVTLKFQ